MNMEGQRCIICYKPYKNGEIKHDRKCPSARRERVNPPNMEKGNL